MTIPVPVAFLSLVIVFAIGAYMGVMIRGAATRWCKNCDHAMQCVYCAKIAEADRRTVIQQQYVA